MKTLFALFLSCVALLGGETLVPLKSGETNMISYSLCGVVSDSRSGTNASPGGDLVLTLRNTGAKWIVLEDVSPEDFILRDAKGQALKLFRCTSSSPGLAYGEVGVIHLRVAEPDAAQPWTLTFNSKPKGIGSVELTITDIKPRRKI